MKSFKKYLDEKLKASDDMGDWVKDFQDSDAPQFKGKSQKKRQQMAIAAKLAAERNEEEVDLGEAVEVSHDRYMRSHGKKASGGEGSWMFTHKRMGDANVNDPKEVHTARGKFSDAKKSAQQWAKKHGHSTVYVMESVELDEVSTKMLRNYLSKANADMDSINKKAENEPSSTRRKLYKRLGNRRIGTSLARGKLTGEPYKKNPGVDNTMLKAKIHSEEVELDEISTEKLRSYASAALQDKNKSKADRRWKYAGKAMDKVADREVKAAHARKYNKMEEVEQLDELSPKTLGSYVKKASADMYDKGGKSVYHSTKVNKASGPFAKETKRKHMTKASDAERKAVNRDTGISRAISRLTKEALDLSESHFKVGQRVECIKSGMTGTVVKSDKPEVGKYYTVKQDSGKMMKYAPEELKAI